MDDQRTVLFTYRRFLERRLPQVEVVVAEDAARGFEVVQQQEVDLVIADYWMPGENGLQFLERVRSASPDTTRVLFTGFGDDAAVDAAQRQGLVQACISKDEDPTRLLERLTRLLAVARAAP